MKKKRQKSAAKKKQSPAIQPQSKTQGRRSFMSTALYAGLGLPIVGGLGFWGYRSFSTTMAEFDLTKIGNGMPAVVQIHDPQCQLCLRLQRQTRTVLKNCSEDNVVYLVASIRTEEGSLLAAEYNVPHVTLLLFDPEGKMMKIVRGPIDDGLLENQIKGHLRKYS